MSSSKFYWEADVREMATKWGQLQKNVQMRVPSAKQKLDDFRIERLVFVQKVAEVRFLSIK
jgi:hypothetical protein